MIFTHNEGVAAELRVRRNQGESAKYMHSHLGTNARMTDLSAAITEITPNEGDLLIFPAYLYHSVGENLSEKDRVIISFNVDIGYK